MTSLNGLSPYSMVSHRDSLGVPRAKGWRPVSCLCWRRCFLATTSGATTHMVWGNRLVRDTRAGKAWATPGSLEILSFPLLGWGSSHKATSFLCLFRSSGCLILELIHAILNLCHEADLHSRYEGVIAWTGYSWMLPLPKGGLLLILSENSAGLNPELSTLEVLVCSPLDCILSPCESRRANEMGMRLFPVTHTHTYTQIIFYHI